MLIVYVGTKGGGGKTTLAVSHIGWLREREENVAYLDADRLGQGTVWLEKAAPEIEVCQATKPAEVENRLNDLLARHSMVIAEGPGGFDKQNVSLIRRANLVVIPVNASPLDIHAAYASTKPLLRAVARRNRGGHQIVRFVVNKLDRRTGFAKDISDFSERMEPPAAKAKVRYLADFIKAANKDFPTRMRGNAERDLQTLFTELMKLVETTSPLRAGNE
ncbi:hypothetical protein OAS39_03760 [Pirellulales bacterium]|nr:hypothetical protein [Pirellulales bacterium]